MPKPTSPNSRRDELLRLYQAMAAHFGPCRWWPGDSPFEVAVGAVLTQNTAWRNVAVALDNLRKLDALRPGPLRGMAQEDLERALRPSGFFRLKARRLRSLLEYFSGHPGWDEEPGALALDSLRSKATPALRAELLAVKGVGAETADCILLYALGRPSFVVDAYTRRIFSRHALVHEGLAYGGLRAFFMDALPEDAALYNEYHALIVRTGHTFCKKSAPRCDLCPLGKFLPHALA